MASNYDAFNDNHAEDQQPSSKKRTLAKYKRSLHDSKELRKQNKWDEKWSRFIQLYSNQYPYSELGDYEDKVVPNMIFSTVNVIVPSIAVHNPKISVTANRQDFEDAADVVTAVVNHQWRTEKVQDEVRQAVKDFIILGHGWVKVTWDTEVEMRPITVDEWKQMATETLMQRTEAVKSSDLKEDEFPTVEESLASLPREVEEVVKDAPAVRRVSPFDVFVDPDAKTLTDARWIAQRMFVPVEVAKKNEDYKRTARSKLRGQVLSEARSDVEVYGAEGESQSKEAAFVIVYEYYNLVDGTVCTFADGLDEYLIDPDKSPFPNGHPFVFLQNYDVPERFYPMGDIEAIYPLQLELAFTRTAMVNDRKRGRRIVLYRSGSFGADGVDDLRSGKDNVMLDVVGDTPFNDVFQQIASQGLHPEWYAQSEQIQQDIDLVSGVSEYARGTMPEIRRTATEAGLMADAANARSSDKLYKVEQSMAGIAERMIRLSQVYLDHEDVAKVVSDEQVVSWVPYDREAIQGEFTFEVEAGSTQPQNESFKRQSALQMMDAIAPFLGTGIINEAKVAEHLFRNGFGIKNTEEFVYPQQMVPLEAVQQMMMDLQGQQAGPEGQPPAGQENPQMGVDGPPPMM